MKTREQDHQECSLVYAEFVLQGVYTEHLGPILAWPPEGCPRADVKDSWPMNSGGLGGRLCWILVTILLLSARVASQADGTKSAVGALAFPAHPRVEYTAQEVEKWRADPSRRNETRQIIARADASLARGLVVPQKSGQWYFYYACPKDGSSLRAETIEKHVCPVCKAEYTDERTVAAYYTILHGRLDEDAHTLALAYALSTDEKYAKPVREVLLELARLYPTWGRHDRWGRRGLLAVVGGRRYAQLLNEAISLIKLAKTYDLVANAKCFSPAERTKIETELLGGNAREILWYQIFAGLRNNHQTWFNAAYTVVGLAIGDQQLMRTGVYGDFGLLWQMKESVTEDGLWYEGALAYQAYAMQAIVETLEAAQRVGWNFSDNQRLRSLWVGPIQLAYPNGQLPVFNDSDPAHFSQWLDLYRWGQKYFQEPSFAQYAGTSPPEATEKTELKSVALRGIGLAVLRRGVGERAQCAMVDYGLHGDHHGHPDKMNIVLYALGRELLLDPGRISYSVPEYETWCRTTVAHNTVVIDQQDQQPDTGRLIFFEQSKDYSAALTASDGAYPAFSLRRFLVMADAIMVDVFVVTGERDAQIDWVSHGPGLLTTDLPLRPRTEPLGEKNGYQHLSDLKQGQGTQKMVFALAANHGPAYRIWCLGDADSAVFTGMGIGYRLVDRVPFILRRRTGRSAVFITVHDLSGDGSAVEEVEQVPVLVDGKALSESEGTGLRIKSGQRVLLIGMDFREAAIGQPQVKGIPFDRCLCQEQ